jgi:tRNA 2-thiouridine synthesizing protein A
MTNHTVARTFDASGMRCPMPILKTKKEIVEVQVGEILKVVATDIGTKKDFPAWSKRTGHEIVEMRDENGKFIWFIKRVK